MSGGVAMMEKAAEQAAQTRRLLRHRELRADAPLAAHPDAEQRAQHQECGVVGREPAQHFHNGIEDEIEHQRQTPAVAIGHKSEEERAYWPERERDGGSKRHLRVGLVELATDRGQAHHYKEEIARVERPAQIS